ncbi:MAG: tyrosine--tRNA ligase [bacterium]|nr:tyrosine--tRNA ligase [bacterium]
MLKHLSDNIQRALAIIERGAVEIIPKEDLIRKLEKSEKTGKPLNIKLGADPSAPDLHLGHTVPLRKLRQFQDLGHQVTFIIGDFTAMIGDPTGKSETRKPLSREQIAINAKTYQDQVFKILDPKKTNVVYNSEWLSPLHFEDVIAIAAKYTVARMLERDDFEKRYRNGDAISIHEFLYPLMQGYDSVAIQADIEIGGTDQKFNLLVGRDLQREYGQEPQVILTLPLIEGTDGVQKMSKSLGNYIGISEPPQEMFGKLMSIPDNLMLKYYELLTDVPKSELTKIESGLKDGSLHPRQVKAELAKIIVTFFYDRTTAEVAAEEFDRIFRDKQTPEQVPVVTIFCEQEKIWIIKALAQASIAKSNSDARRLIQQNAVELDGLKVTDVNLELMVGKTYLFHVGRKFYRLELKLKQEA